MRVSERRTVSGLSEVAGARWFRTAIMLTGVVGAGVVLGGAGCGSADCSFDATCLDPSDASADASVEFPPGCNPTGDLNGNLACVSGLIGIFVSSTQGNDVQNDGSRGAPFRSLERALPLYSRQRHRIYICAGNYPSNLVIDAARSGVEIWGGLSCDWTTFTGERAKITAADPSRPAVTWKGATSGKVRDVELSAGDATQDGGSSIAAFASGSTLDFVRVKLLAGNGKKAANAILQPFTFFTADELKGNKASDSGGGGQNSRQCQTPAQTTIGGKGGNSGAPGDRGLPEAPGTGTPGSVTSCGSGGTGGDGKKGDNGKDALSIDVVGTLTSDNWTGRAGTDGEHGHPGQGGGGGGGNGGNGGGGGAGGCGGTGGPGGSAGGSSIALVSVSSRLNLVDSELESGVAGDGGNGARGQPGQPIGGGGGDRTGNACNGGNGGAGGDGGAGGGGAGGISVGVVFSGEAPKLDTATQTRIKTASQGGAAGAGGASGNPGIQGVARPTLAL
ncbi:hypothetical protein LZC95_14225 [Pendulispora brunnea]|uniref:PE-PGRS family protein n=1 Tax=Pendulispora brunnea TaxID=2905690 RepID=A0ABZ2KVN7_9BACT